MSGFFFPNIWYYWAISSIVLSMHYSTLSLSSSWVAMHPILSYLIDVHPTWAACATRPVFFFFTLFTISSCCFTSLFFFVVVFLKKIWFYHLLCYSFSVSLLNSNMHIKYQHMIRYVTQSRLWLATPIRNKIINVNWCFTDNKAMQSFAFFQGFWSLNRQTLTYKAGLDNRAGQPEPLI